MKFFLVFIVLRFKKVRLKIEEAHASSTGSPFIAQITKDAEEVIRNYIVPHQNTWMLNAIAASSMHLE